MAYNVKIPWKAFRICPYFLRKAKLHVHARSDAGYIFSASKSLQVEMYIGVLVCYGPTIGSSF